ncbi:hypothetical protein [Paenibacillus sp. UNC499MF]|uniref:hypothetical protein n=1 Tax=Paenibacillus sp. UNC499MF TaxID=1502751 RepID=UPI0008A0696A|nr:hypothetical protein [Paenibacillus sp. UNC499MF]SEG70017.1 hypothetical protein SAMN02799616_04362 [Paenibacillus sp. UNC499MF]
MKTLKIECIRAFYSRSLLFAILAGLAISIIHIATSVLPYYPVPLIGAQFMTPYLFWLGIDGASFTNMQFYYLLPLLASIPYADSYYQDYKSGFKKLYLIRTTKVSYYSSKLLAVMLVGGISILVPLLFDLAVSAMILPSVLPPHLSYMSYFSVQYGSEWLGLFFEHPFLYIFIFIGIACAYAAVFAALSYGISFFLKNRFVVLSAVFLLNLIATIIIPYKWIPFVLMRASTGMIDHHLFRIITTLLFCLLIACILIFLGSRRRDVID